MSEQTRTRWKNAMRAIVPLCVKPALFLLAGILLIVALGIAQRLGWISGGGGGATTHQAGSHEEGSLYICPMMCTPPLSEPGRCPVCGMELVPLSSNDEGGDVRSIQIDPASRRVANIRTVAVKSVSALREIQTVGRLDYDEGKLKTLAAYVDGRLDRLYADYTGVVVNKGDVLALLYSPELYTAQSELLAAKRTAETSRDSMYSDGLDARSLVKSARQKLMDLGMTEQQVAKLEETRQSGTRIELVAPIHGTVIDRQALEGTYVKTGQPIYRLADLSTLWLMLELFPEDAAAVRYGQRVAAEMQSLPGEEFTGRVAFVDPMVDPKTRTVGVRVVISNDNGRLKAGDYATATIKVPLSDPNGPQTKVYDPELAGKWISPRHPQVVQDGPGKCSVCGIELVPATKFGYSDKPLSIRKHLVVPRDAVLMAGHNSVVYVEGEPGRFELRRVELGPSLGDQIVLLSGVSEGEQVATNGNFLIDSQMQLAGKPSLIDPEKAETRTSGNETITPEIAAALAELSEKDRALAEKQRICPVTEMLLGSMGVPLKVDVGGRTVFICCEGCREPLLEESEKYLAVLDKAATTEASGENAPGMDLPEIGAIEMIDSASEDSGDKAFSSGDLPLIGPIEEIESDQEEKP